MEDQLREIQDRFKVFRAELIELENQMQKRFANRKQALQREIEIKIHEQHYLEYKLSEMTLMGTDKQVEQARSDLIVCRAEIESLEKEIAIVSANTNSTIRQLLKESRKDRNRSGEEVALLQDAFALSKRYSDQLPSMLDKLRHLRAEYLEVLAELGTAARNAEVLGRMVYLLSDFNPESAPSKTEIDQLKPRSWDVGELFIKGSDIDGAIQAWPNWNFLNPRLPSDIY